MANPSESPRPRLSQTRTADKLRSAKRRASRACRNCRLRKVRCDFVDTGSPCTNCRLDLTECVMLESRRNKRPQDKDALFHTPSPSAVDDVDELPLCLTFDCEIKQESPQSPDDMISDSGKSAKYSCTEYHTPHSLYQSKGRLSSVGDARDPTTSNGSRYLSDIPHFVRTGGYCYAADHEIPWKLPGYIRPLTLSMPTEDLEYLFKKGALQVPDTALRSQILQGYLQHVHPFMPILDLSQFLTSLQPTSSTGSVSLLLFQAVMFAGVAFVDVKTLQARGYKNQKEARRLLFERVRLLYDFNIESDRTTLLQSMLLMSYRYEKGDDKDTWYWLGISLSLAHTMGMHRNPEHLGMDPDAKRLRRRIWWSCFIRDRLIALGTRRPTRIRSDEFDVPMLTLADFDLEPLSGSFGNLFGGVLCTQDMEQSTALATSCIELAKLCVRLGHVLSSQYSVLGHKLGWETENTMMLVPKRSAKQVYEVDECDNELAQWYQELAPEARYTMPDTTGTSLEEVCSLHRAILYVVYLATLIALHRPQAFLPMPNVAEATGIQRSSRRKLREAALQITEVANHLNSQDQVRILPTTGVTVVLAAIISHLLDVKCKDAEIRRSSMLRFYQCVKVLQQLRDVYASADSAVLFVAAAIQKAHIEMPLPKTEMKPTLAATPQEDVMNEGPTMQDDLDRRHAHSPDQLQMAKILLYNTSMTQEERRLWDSASPLLPEAEHNTKLPYNQVRNKRIDFNDWVDFSAHHGSTHTREDGVEIDMDRDWKLQSPSIDIDGYEFPALEDYVMV